MFNSAGALSCSVPCAHLARGDVLSYLERNADLVDRPFFYVPTASGNATLALMIKFSIDETPPTADDLWPRVLGAIESLHAAHRALSERPDDDESRPVMRG